MKSILRFDTVCALTDMNYVVFHGTVGTSTEGAYQEYYIRHVDGHPISSEGERQRVIQCLEAAIERRTSEGLELELRTEDRVGLLSDITRIFRENGLTIKRAEISTESGKAVDTFYLSDMSGSPVESKTVESIRTQIGETILRVKNNSASPPRSPDESMSVLANIGDLYVFCLAVFLYLLMQCEARVKKLRDEDTVMQDIRTRRRAQKNWGKLRKFVMYTWGPSNLDPSIISGKRPNRSIIDSLNCVGCLPRERSLSQMDPLQLGESDNIPIEKQLPTKLLCRKCGNYIGSAYDEDFTSNGSDGPDSSSGIGVSDRRKYNIKISALQPLSDFSPLSLYLFPPGHMAVIYAAQAQLKPVRILTETVTSVHFASCLFR